MATFYINGRFYATQEYSYYDEVEADSLEEAVELHKAQCEGRKWPDVEADPCDKPFNIEGRFDVFETEEGREDWDHEDMLVEAEEWIGSR
jgi:hypothetical protein